MGREAYLARLALGRSAFEAPLRDENGDLLLGGQARKFDDQSYSQQWDDRGHPINPASEKRAKLLSKAQNEILQACGVIVKKAEKKRKKQKGQDITEAAQVDVVSEENQLGFLFKCADKVASDTLTWWLDSLRRRMLAFGAPKGLLIDNIRRAFSAGPSALLFGGLPAFWLSSLTKVLLYNNDDEPLELMNYLGEANTRPSTSSWKEWVWTIFGEVSLHLPEIPLELLSGLQSLGFAIWPVIRTTLHGLPPERLSSLKELFTGFPSRDLRQTIALYLLRSYLEHQVYWRIFGLLRQTIIRPVRPSQPSIRAWEQDELLESGSVVGMGRGLGTHTGRRHYGPQSFWPALTVAFPWLSMLVKPEFDKDEIKTETLARCKLMEFKDERVGRMSHIERSMMRSRNIISNLESLGVDVEEDFYVDVDQWTREIDCIESVELDVAVASPPESLVDVEMVDAPPLITEGSSAVPLQLNESAQDPSNDELAATSAELAFQPDIIIDVPAGEPHATPSPPNEPASESQPGPEPDQPSTPEQGIRRATSLSLSTYTTTRPSPVRQPIRRLTETNGGEGDSEFEAEIEAMIARSELARSEYLRNPKSRARTKKKAKDKKEHRVTRLSTFPADALARYSSIVITKFMLLPVEALYYHSMARWFLSLTASGAGSSTVAAAILPVGNFRKSSLSSWPSAEAWRSYKMLLLTLGIEALVSCAIWQIGSACSLWCRRDWGRF